MTSNPPDRDSRDPARDSPAASAESVYADYRRRVADGESVDFETFCAEHARIAGALQALHSLSGGSVRGRLTVRQVPVRRATLSVSLILLALLRGPIAATEFIRGDSNASGVLDISDAISSLSYQFVGTFDPPCLDALDFDDGGSIDVSDPIGTLLYLFASGPAPQPPFPDCGEDPTNDDLACEESSCPTEPETTIALLIVLMDFQDTSMPTHRELDEPAEASWSRLLFGTEQGQGNHYWSEVSHGSFGVVRAVESFGLPDNGVIHVTLEENVPREGRFRPQDQGWIPEALNKASAFISFGDYDANSDGELDNTELSILVVLNLPFQRISGAGAEANIAINHTVDGVTIKKFARTQFDYTSIGVNLHELAHHMFDLPHGAFPNGLALMGTGAYNEDSEITRFHDSSHWGTRPAHLTAHSKILAGFVEPALVTDTALGVKLYKSTSPHYNVVQVPVVDGFLYLENRQPDGYDASIPFCHPHGGVFATEVIVFQSSYEVAPDMSSAVCGYYSLAGHNDTFQLGGFTFTNFSGAGDVMTFDIVNNGLTPTIASYRFRYWTPDPKRAGYRQWQYVPVPESGEPVAIDFATFVDGDDPEGYFTITLQAIYNTGDIRSVNLATTWSTESGYLQIQKFPINFQTDAIVRLTFDGDAPYESSATVVAEHGEFRAVLNLTDLPE